MELDCRSFHADSEFPQNYIFMAPEWESTFNDAAHNILGGALCRLESDGSRPLLSVQAARSALSGVRVIS